MFDFEPESIVPDKCRDCGVQCDIGRNLIKLMLLKNLVGYAAEHLVGEPGEQVDAMIDEAFPAEMADEAKSTIRKGAEDKLTDIDTDIEALRDEVNANALACNGVLRMRATKGDVTYTVNVCTSARVYDRDNSEPMHLPMHIRADSVYRASSPNSN